MPDAQTQKAAMLAEILTDLPDGVRSFLETPLPAAPQLTAPNDVDAAIITQAEFCVWMGQVFGAFEGLTPVQIPMYIAQLNTVQQGMLLASLEARPQPADDEDAGPLRITEPAAGGTYSPGSLRITATVDDSVEIESITGTCGGVEFEMEPDGDRWRHTMEIGEIGDYSLRLSATVPDADPVTASAQFRIGDPAEEDTEPASGSDVEAAQKSESKIADAVRDMFDAPVETASDILTFPLRNLRVVHSELVNLWEIGSKLFSGDAGGAMEQLVNERLGYLDELYDQLSTIGQNDDGSFTGGDFLAIISPTLGQVSSIATAIRTFVQDKKR